MSVSEVESVDVIQGDQKESPPVLVGSSRWKLAAVHLLSSVLVLLILAAAVFMVWYPPPFASLSGGLTLFGIVALVDVVLGPLGTLVVSNPRKARREWRRDVAMIVGLQLMAMAYGVWTVYQARPVYLAFEVDRLRAVHAVDVPAELLDRAPVRLQQLPLLRPELVAVRPFRDENERMEVTLAALQGLDMGARPDLWMDFYEARSAVLSAAQPVSTLMAKLGAAERPLLETAVNQTGMPMEQLVYLPLVSRTFGWTALLDPQTARPLAFAAVDAFEH